MPKWHFYSWRDPSLPMYLRSNNFIFMSHPFRHPRFARHFFLLFPSFPLTFPNKDSFLLYFFFIALYVVPSFANGGRSLWERKILPHPTQGDRAFKRSSSHDPNTNHLNKSSNTNVLYEQTKLLPTKFDK